MISASWSRWWMLRGRHSVNSFSLYPVGTGKFHFSEPPVLLLSIENESTLNGQIVRRRCCPYSLSILDRSKCTCELVSNVSLGLRASSWRAAALRLTCSACSSVLHLSTYFGKTYLLYILGWPVLTYLWFTRALVL